MAKHKRYHNSEADPRRRAEMEEGGMIHEDRSEIANLPQDVKMKPYPPYDGYMPDAPDDTIKRIDQMMDESDKKIRAHLKPRKA